MRYARPAFTLIELLISVSILSIMIVFLYKSYASLNYSNRIYKEKSTEIQTHQIKKKLILLDFSLLISKDVKILNQDRDQDVVFFQSSHSIHKRYNPYIAYIAKDSKLYRLEALKEFKTYPLANENIFDVDYFGEIDNFRVYKSKQITKTKDTNESSKVSNSNYLVHVNFKKEDNIIYKIKPFNSFD